MKTYPMDTEEAGHPPAPRVKVHSGPSLVWLIPLITALVGGWLIIKTLSEKGPEITVTFRTAEGIEAGKTKVKYKAIEIGVVESVHFGKDFSHVIVKARVDKGAASLLRRDTRIWVVTPRLGLRGATGLGTLLSGAYLEIEPGKGSPQRHFVGLELPPVVRADVPGKRITLLASRLGSIDTGSPLYYQGILAGEVLGWELGSDRKSVFIHAFVKTPYDAIVRSNTRFWNVSGMEVSLGAEGLNVRMESAESLLYGGIAFETPETAERTRENVEGLVFTLWESYRSIREQTFTHKATFVLFFEGSVRGLQPGAPVEFRGIKVGSVTDVRLEFDGRDASFRIPVLIELEPERIIDTAGAELSSPREIWNTLVARGLRAQLQTGSLLTGQLFVSLDMHPGTPVRLVKGGGSYPELPTIPATLEQLTGSLRAILARIENVNVERIGAELLETLEGATRLAKGASELVGKPELRGTVDDLQGSLLSLKSILRKLDQRAEPLAVNLGNVLAAGHQALENLRATLGLVNDVVRPDSPLQYRMVDLGEELTETARSIRTLVDLLERNPNALIFGKGAPGEKR